jgi:hypothetical protein
MKVIFYFRRIEIPDNKYPAYIFAGYPDMLSMSVYTISGMITRAGHVERYQLQSYRF